MSAIKNRWAASASRIASQLVAALMLLAGCATNSTSGDALHLNLDQLAAQYRVCSVAVATIRERKLDAIETAGPCMSPAPMQDSVFQAASLSKPVFAYAALKLAQQGRLDLDAPMMQYLPQGYQHVSNLWANSASWKKNAVTDPRLRSVTARMLLNHSAGLPNWANGPLRFSTAPGTAWEYSGEGYLLLQRVVEAITEEKLDRWMTSRLFTPSSMTNTDYIWQSRFEPRLVPGTAIDGTPLHIHRFTEPVAAATLYTSVADYAKFLVMLLNDNRTLEQIVDSPVTVDPDLNLSWGLGWGIQRSPDDLLIFQWGNNPGYRAFVIASAHSGNGLVMLTSSENGLALAEPLTSKVLPGTHPVFRFHMLRDGLAYWLCETFRFCV